MQATVRRAGPVLLGLLVVACTAVVPRTPSASTIRTAVAPRLTPVPGAPSPISAAGLPSQTTTAFGPVWDALPSSWPGLPGQSASEIGSDASATLVVKGKPLALAGELRTALRARGWMVDVGSPLEDGSVVLDATRDPAGCLAEARFQPNQPGSNDGTLLVYYGASCPFQ
ncbi:MAG TPA: hypothetical protein VFI34_12870 [Candidatus Limnocylindrales bacterium]|nr:hypothetical protein [Candidatus Limnocylindrales bacterium]